MRLGFIGTGRMGRPMLRKLIGAGHEVQALGRSADKRGSLAEEGARVTSGVAETGVGTDAVLVCVYADEQVQDVCLGSDLLARMPRGSVVVVHTTCSPHTIEAIAARAAPRRIAVIDAPVSGGPHNITAGQLTLFVGGADDAVARIRPVLAAYGDPILHVGPPGAGQRVKLLNNALFAAQVGLLADAVRIGTYLGVDEPVLLRALAHGSAASRALDSVVPRGSVAVFAAAVRDFLAKDVTVAREIAAELAVGLGSLDQAISSLPGFPSAEATDNQRE